MAATQGDVPSGWVPVGSGRFQQIALPMSEEAIRLNGDRPRFIFYGEFDTEIEGDAWQEFLYDPLKTLRAEHVDLPDPGGHLGIRILKLEADGQEPSDEYVEAVKARAEAAEEIMGDSTAEDVDRNIHVVTTVLNHEVPLNPRIGTVF